MHEDTKDNGVVIEAACGWFAKTRLQRAQGAYIDFVKDGMTLENVAENWGKATDFGTANYAGWVSAIQTPLRKITSCLR